MTPQDQGTAAASPSEDLGSELGEGHLSQAEVVGITISGFVPAVGLATVPAFVASYAGINAWLPLLAATLTFIAIAMMIQVFARRFVGTGSLFSYIRQVMGPSSSVLMAAALIPGYVIAVASLILGAGLYFGSFLVARGVESAGETGWQIAIAVAVSALTIAIVYRGIDVSVRTSVLLTVLSVPVIVVVTVATLFKSTASFGAQFNFDGLTVDAFLQGMAIGAAFYVGFESTASLATETKDPKRVIPRVLLLAPAGLGLVYFLGALVQVPTLVQRSGDLALGISPPAVLADNAGLGALGEVTDLILGVAIFASLIAFTNYGARVMASAAQQGLLPRKLLDVHPRFHSPVNAMLAVIVPACLGPVVLLLLSDTTPLDLYGIVATLLVYAWVVPYVMVCIAAPLVLRREGRPWIGGLVVGSVVAVIVVFLYVNGIVNPGPSPLDAMPYVMAVILVVFLAGLAVAWRRRATDDVIEL